jgi:hypothetical protein
MAAKGFILAGLLRKIYVSNKILNEVSQKYFATRSRQKVA